VFRREGDSRYNDNNPRRPFYEIYDFNDLNGNAVSLIKTVPENVTNRAKKETNRRKKRPKRNGFWTQKPGLFLRETAISLLSTHSLADATAQFPMLRSTHCTAASSALTELRSGQKKQKAHHATLFLSQKDVAWMEQLCYDPKREDEN